MVHSPVVDIGLDWFACLDLDERRVPSLCRIEFLSNYEINFPVIQD